MAIPTINPIVTARLTIRRVTVNDLTNLFEINGDEQVTLFLPYVTWQSMKDSEAWLNRMEALAAGGTGVQLVIIRNIDSKIIGTTLLFRYEESSARTELGYVVGRAHWRQGYATEALTAVCRYAFNQMGIRRIEAEVDPRNTASNQVMRTLGFVKEGLLRKRWVTKGEPTDTYIYGCLAEEWKKS
jgi:RimJ/RimL family protein N-acetyltransferase